MLAQIFFNLSYEAWLKSSSSQPEKLYNLGTRPKDSYTLYIQQIFEVCCQFQASQRAPPLTCLQVRMCNWKLLFLFLNQNICCWKIVDGK